MHLFGALGSRTARSLCWHWQAAAVAVPRPLVPQEPAPCSTNGTCRNPRCPQVGVDEPCSKGKETPSGAEADLSDWESVLHNITGHEKEEGCPHNRRTNEAGLPRRPQPWYFVGWRERNCDQRPPDHCNPEEWRGFHLDRCKREDDQESDDEQQAEQDDCRARCVRRSLELRDPATSGDACISEKVDHRIGESLGEYTQQPRSLGKGLFLATMGTSSAWQGNLHLNGVAPSRSWNRTCAKARLDTSSVAWQSVHSKLVRRACMRLLDFGIPSCTPSRSVASKSGYGPRVSWESGQRRHGRPRHDTRTGPPDPSTSFRAGVSSFPQTRQVSLSRLRRLERDWPRSRPGPTTGTIFYLSAFECLVPIWPDWRSQLSRSG